MIHDAPSRSTFAAEPLVNEPSLGSCLLVLVGMVYRGRTRQEFVLGTYTVQYVGEEEMQTFKCSILVYQSGALRNR
jgi:hypothetical protein